jgi:hypothetical protein
MPHDVFVSYAHPDKAIAEKVCALVERNGFSCWIAPRDILPGMTWAASIVKAIKQCRAMVLVYSANSNQSDQIPREVALASEHGVRVIPLRTEDVRPGGDLEYYLPSTQWLDVFPGSLEDHTGELLRVVRAVLAREPWTQPRVIKPQPKPSRRKYLLGVGAAVALALALIILWPRRRPAPAPQPVVPSAPGRMQPVSKDACLQGFVWREAVPHDHVCVTPQTRAQTALDNRLAPTRVNATDHRYGPDTCVVGFVWREAVPNDHVCVTAEVRSRAAEDNKLATNHRAAF